MRRPKSPAQQVVYDFIVRNRAGALATASKKGVPHVVTIYSVIDEDFSLYFATRVEGRKYKNLIANPQIALCFTDEKDMQTVQMMGKVERVKTLETEQRILYELIKLRFGEPDWPVPPVKMFERGTTNELAIMKIVPTEITLATFKTSPKGRYEPFFKKIL